MKRRGAPVLLWAAVALEVAARPASEGRAPLLRRGQLREALPQLGAAAAARQPRMPRPVQMSYWGDFEERNAGDACKPKCRWSCEAPECSEVCNITCAPALCATACPPVDQRSCKTVCPPPNCKTFCSGNCVALERRTSPCAEADCRTECDPPHPLCRSECDVHCDSRCAAPVCRFSCHEPKDCPKPECRLKCEKSSGCPFPKVGERLPTFPEGMSTDGFPKALSKVNFLVPAALMAAAPPPPPGPAPEPAPAPAPLPAPTQLIR
ncbi:unnamed protein product [Prorocentrum cordatum]|nr:unnamed protein product [Polarella glacialis]|mmetsp:Transcript_15226/g.40446  ORF Transcript_15226/g.40446 Transcript_15226/m.40446 type:complete len:265 (-) Transcript_15226:11-805(-)